jgi:hypothetical protein
VNVCRDLIGNTICADLLDYLHRDWHHLGKPRYFDLRLLEYMEIRRNAREEHDAHLVLNLRDAHKVRTDAVTAILDLLESRYQLAEIALFHRTKLCAAAMLERVVAELRDSADQRGAKLIEDLPDQLLDRSDEGMLELLASLLKEEMRLARSGRENDLAPILSLLRRLRQRKLHKEFYTALEYRLADGTGRVQDIYAGPEGKKNEASSEKMKRAGIGAGNRLAALRTLERDFGLPRGSIVMYCSPRKAHVKIAEVQVLVHGQVQTLDRFESEHGDRGVTGGHLNAQKQRFRRLWKILFAIDPAVNENLERLGLTYALRRAIEACVLGQSSSGSLEEASRSIAQDLLAHPGSPYYGKQSAPLVAHGRSQAAEAYPTGAPAISRCIVP